MKAVIRLGDTTSHGGSVIESFSQAIVNGKSIAGKGHMTVCPQCKGSYPIIEGSAQYRVDGIPVALEGMKTACGATLIASDQSQKVAS